MPSCQLSFNIWEDRKNSNLPILRDRLHLTENLMGQAIYEDEMKDLWGLRGI